MTYTCSRCAEPLEAGEAFEVPDEIGVLCRDDAYRATGIDA